MFKLIKNVLIYYKYYNFGYKIAKIVLDSKKYVEL